MSIHHCAGRESKEASKIFTMQTCHAARSSAVPCQVAFYSRTARDENTSFEIYRDRESPDEYSTATECAILKRAPEARRDNCPTSRGGRDVKWNFARNRLDDRIANQGS